MLSRNSYKICYITRSIELYTVQIIIYNRNYIHYQAGPIRVANTALFHLPHLINNNFPGMNQHE